MTKRFVFSEIMTKLEANLKDYGFRFIKSKERIIRKHEIGFDIIIFHIIDYNPLFEIDFTLRTRINKVEEIVNMFMHDRMNPDFMNLTETVSISYKELSKLENDYMEVNSEENLYQTIDILISLIKTKGLSFFERNKNINKVNEIKKELILKGEYRDRRTIMQSLTLMKLCKDPDFDELSEKYKKIYIPFAGEEEIGLKAINDLIAYLKND